MHNPRKHYLGENYDYKLSPTLEKEIKEGKIMLGGCFYSSSSPNGSVRIVKQRYTNQLTRGKI